MTANYARPAKTAKNITVTNSNGAEMEFYADVQAQALSSTHPFTHGYCGWLCWQRSSQLSSRPPGMRASQQRGLASGEGSPV